MLNFSLSCSQRQTIDTSTPAELPELAAEFGCRGDVHSLAQSMLPVDAHNQRERHRQRVLAATAADGDVALCESSEPATVSSTTNTTNISANSVANSSSDGKTGNPRRRARAHCVTQHSLTLTHARSLCPFASCVSPRAWTSGD